jgi:hypothetical protein
LFDVVTYTGNTATTRLITGLNFSPDLVWIKNRGSTYWNVLFDVVRGVGNQLSSNQTDAELASGSNIAGKVSSFDANGFTLASGSSGIYTVNENNVGHVAWCWDAGSSTVTNTQGSITSQVRANASAGFSVVTYTGNGSNATVGHGLGVAPGLIIVKARSRGDSWRVYHSALGATKYLTLESTAAAGTVSSVWIDTAPTSAVFSVGTESAVNTNAATQVAYCFAPVAGYSAFGSYTGNGSADGPFVYTGFRPRYVLQKKTSDVSAWSIRDAARDPYNAANTRLWTNFSSAESSADAIDILSNGFKVRNTDTDWNASGATYIYAAFAESPFAANNRAR